MYVQMKPLGPNLWAVERDACNTCPKLSTCVRRTSCRPPVKIAEVMLRANDGECRMVPVEGFALTADELSGIRSFMAQAHAEPTALRI